MGPRRNAKSDVIPGRRALAGVVAGVVALGLGGCGGDDDEKTSSARAATGKPIRLGLMNQDRGPIGVPELSAGAVAAAKFMNADKGGIDGRPAELVKCSTDGTPESTARCGAMFVDKRVEAVIDLFDLATGPLHPTLDDAGIPVIGGAAQVPEDFASKTSFWLTSGGQGYISGAVAFLANRPGTKRITYLAMKIPTLDRDVKEYIEPVAKARGVEVDVVPFDVSTTDFSAVVAAGLRSKPDAMFTFTSDQLTPPIIQAVRSAGFTGPFVAGASTSFAKALPPDAAKGVSTMVGLYSVDEPEKAPADKRRELEEYLAAMKEHAPSDKPPAALTQVGFSMMMTVGGVLREIGADRISPAAIMKAFRADVDRPKHMGRTFNCAKNGIPSNVGLCAREVTAVTWDGSRFRSDGDWFDGVSLTEAD